MLGYLETAVTARNGAPLGATVEVLELPTVGAPVTTDPAVGDYHRMLLPGNYTLRFSAAGYQDWQQTVTVTAGAATPVDVQLKR